MHYSNCSQVMQAPEPPIPAGCILAFSYCRTGSKISWCSLVCSWITFLLPSPFSWQWVLGQRSQISQGHSSHPLLWDHSSVYSLSSEDRWRMRSYSPLFSCSKFRPFSWDVAQVFSQVLTFTLKNC